MMAKSRAGLQLTNDKEFLKMIEKLDKLVQFKVVDKALRAGSVPVRSAMRKNAPDSSKTGSVAKWSRSTKAKWATAGKLKNTIKSVLRKNERGSIALIGPSYSDGGGHGNFFASDHKRKVLWGRDSGQTRVVNRFVKKTADETAAQARAAVVATAKKEIAIAAKEASRRG